MNIYDYSTSNNDKIYHLVCRNCNNKFIAPHNSYKIF